MTNSSKESKWGGGGVVPLEVAKKIYEDTEGMELFSTSHMKNFGVDSPAIGVEWTYEPLDTKFRIVKPHPFEPNLWYCEKIK